MSVVDISLGTSGVSYSHQRIYDNLNQFYLNGPNGYGWRTTFQPNFERRSDGFRAAFLPHNVVIFNLMPDAQGIYLAKQNFPDTLRIDNAAKTYIVTRRSGRQWTFSNDPYGSVPQGMLKTVADIEGNVTEYQYANNRLWKVVAYRQSQPANILAEMEFTYDSAGRYAQITLRKRIDGTLQPEKRVTYSYYTGAESFGSSGDLKLVRTETYASGVWLAGDTSYYRYYQTGQANGRAHLLKMVFEPVDFDAFVTAYGYPACLSVEDANALEFSTKYYEYDSRNRVNLERVDRNRRTIQLEYTAYPDNEDFNAVHVKTVETGARGEKQTVFTNFKGKVLLREITPPSGSEDETQIFYFQYNDAGKITHRYSPKSIIGYSPQVGYPTRLMVNLSPNEGRIDITQYGDGNTAAAYSVVREMIQRGTSGTPITLTEYEYEKRQVDARIAWNLTRQTQYAGEDGSSPVSTRYTYSYYPNSLQASQETTILPAVTQANNGTGVSPTRVTCYDEVGRTTWSKDEMGIITYHQYDTTLGVEVKNIQDVNTSKTSDFTTPVPPGWTTASIAGKHLVTEMQYDADGRLIQTLGPQNTAVGPGNTAITVRPARWTVYDRANRRTLNASGYATVDANSNIIAWTLANPVSITLYDHLGRTTDSITASRASTAGKLLATDTFLRSDYLGWRRNFYQADDLVAVWEYFNIPATGDGIKDVDYSVTLYGYDTYGTQNLVTEPDGVMTKTVHDWQGNATQTWRGTSAADMVILSETVYGGEDGGCSTCTGTSAKPRLTIQYVDADHTRITEYGYDWRGRQIHTHGEEDENGVSTYNLTTYDNIDRAVKSERFVAQTSGDRLLARTEHFYDERGNTWKVVQSVVNPNTGAVTGTLDALYWFDLAGRSTQSRSFGVTRLNRTTYDSLGRTAKSDVALSDGTVWAQNELTYDTAGNILLTSTAQRLPNQTGTGALNIIASPQGRFHFTASWYDPLSRQIATADYGTNGDTPLVRPDTVPPRSNTTLVSTTTYDDKTGRVLSTTDQAGQIIELECDLRGNVIKRTLPKPNATSPEPVYETEYDIYGRMIAQIDPLGNRTQTLYDAWGRTAATLDALGNRSEYVYNRAGEVIETIDPMQRTTQYVYDNLGRRVRTILPRPDENVANPVLATVYNPSGQVAEELDPLGNVTRMEYDGLGRQTAVVDAEGGRTEYVYDDEGKLLSLKDPVGNVTSYTYDALSRVTQETNALNKTRVIDYFAGDLVAKKTDRNGRWITFTYDRFDRKTSEQWYDANGAPVRTLTFMYDALGRTLLFRDPDSTYTYGYDNAGRTTQIAMQPSRLGVPIIFDQTFDLAGRKTSVATRVGIVNDFTNIYAYTPTGQTASIAQSGTGIQPKRVTYDYNAAGQPVQKTAFASLDDTSQVCATTMTYDGMNRLNLLKHTNGDTVFATYDLGWDAKRLTNFDITTPAATKTAAYSYDDTDQLTVADYNFQTDESYTYDANGNRTNNNFTTGTNNQLTSDGVYTYTYDDEGNCTSKRRTSNNETTTYTWDHRNRLIKVVTPTATVDYAYDHMNRLVRRNDEFTVNTDYQITLILHPDGTVKQRQFWGATTDELLTEETVTLTSWALTDHLGTVRDTLSSTGTILNHLEYNAFGLLTTSTNPATLPLHLYTAKPFDTTTSIQYNVNRWYDPTIGRWISEDTIELGKNNTNLYVYVQNNTITNVDYNGRALQFAAAIGVGAVKTWAILTNVSTITSIFALTSHFVPSTGEIVYQNGGGSPTVTTNTGGGHVVHLTKTFQKIYPDSVCATHVEIVSEIDIYDSDLFSSDLMGNFTHSITYTKSKYQKENQCGVDPNFAHGVRVGITCRTTYVSQCFTLDGKVKEVCDPMSGIDVAYEYAVKMYVYAGSAKLETLNIAGKTGLQSLGKYVCK